MKTLRKLSFKIITIFSVTACSVTPVKLGPPVIEIDVKHRVENANPIAYTCNKNHYVPAIYNNSTKLAVNYFKYAVFSSNSYENQLFISIPDWERISRYQTEYGFSADVYENITDDKVTEVVVAFRGTDDFFYDTFYANGLIANGGQYASALKLVKDIKLNKRYSSSKITAVGHSLGGGLALHVSSRVEGVNAYVFDSSPRVFAPEKNKVKNNFRVSIRERGEALSYISWFWRFGIDKVVPTNQEYLIDFFENGYVGDHASYGLARGMLLMAAVNKDPVAIEVQNGIGNCNFSKIKPK